MSRRIEVELTSSRNDGVWTWRAAGARQPKGELDGSLLYPGAKVGDVVRADADFDIEGINVVSVLAPKGARVEPERLEIIGPPRRDEPGVTTVLAPKGRGRRDRGDREDRGERGDRGPRREGPRGPGGPGGARGPGGPGGPGARRDGRDAGRGPRDGQGGDGRRDRPRETAGAPRGADDRDRRGRGAPRAARPPVDAKPKAKRLKAGRTHRQALLHALPETHRPIADLLMRGGIPSVRQALDRQNALLKADGKSEIRPEPLLDIADRLMPSIRTAEWRDKAEAALAAGDDVDLKDLRSVVVAADAAARDEASRELAAQLRDAVTARVDREHQAWLSEIAENLAGNRLVRALRLSSRPPKAGVPFPKDLAQRLVEATAAGLTAEITADRFATLLDALAFSPIRLQVTATSVPSEPSAELVQAVKKAGSRVPQIAAQFGIEATASAGARAAKPAGQKPLPPKPIPPKPPVAPIADASGLSGEAQGDADAKGGPAPTAQAVAPPAAPEPPVAAQPVTEVAVTERADAAPVVAEAVASADAPTPASADT